MTLYLEGDWRLEDQFRAEVARRYGNKKGNIGKALREAISMWIRQEEKR